MSMLDSITLLGLIDTLLTQIRLLGLLLEPIDGVFVFSLLWLDAKKKIQSLLFLPTTTQFVVCVRNGIPCAGLGYKQEE